MKGKLRWGQTWFSVFNRITNRRADDSTVARPDESRRNLPHLKTCFKFSTWST